MSIITAEAYSTSPDEVLMHLRTTLNPTKGHSIAIAHGERYL